MARRILIDWQWSLIQPCCLGQEDNRAKQAETRAWLLKRYCRLRAPVLRGGICRKSLVSQFGVQTVSPLGFGTSIRTY